MSRTKGCISLLLVLCLMIGHLSPIALAMENHVVVGETAAESPMDLAILSDQVMTGSCGEALTWTISDDGVLTISGTGEMADYSDELPAPWNDYPYQIGSVVISDGVTSIGDHAFSGLSYLMEVEIGDDVEVIGYKAFYNCEILDLQLGTRLRVIEDHAFQNTGLFGLRVPDSVTAICDYAFAGCRNLHTLDIYRADVTIGEGAFSSCEQLENVSLGMGRVTIGDRAFSGCTGITEIFFGENVIEIGSFAFENCDGIQRIHFYGAAPKFGEQVFKNVTAVVIYPENDDSWMECISQEYGGNLTWLVYIDCWNEGHVYEAVVTEPTCEEEGFTTYTCFYCGDCYTDNYVQPLGHNFVDGVCTNCNLVLEIVAEGQTDQDLVWKLDNLGTLTISGSGYMFGFSKPENAPWYAYKNRIRTLVIENGVLSIGYNAFYQYIYLAKVEIASSVGGIDSQAFYSCRYLRDIVFEGSPPAIEWNSFYDVTASATYPSDGGWTDEHLQDYGGSITWVEKQICDSAEHIYEAVVTAPSCAEMGYTTHICTMCGRSYVEAYTNALGHSFEDGECTVCGLTESIVAEGACGENLVWKLTDDGLLDISGTGEMTGAPWETYKDRITCAVIHDGVTSVAAKAFNNCAILESVAIPDSVTEFYASFGKCTNLSVVVIPDSVIVCSPYFEDCINLEYVELPNGMKKIGSWMFGGCKKLKSIDIPDTVTIIQNNAFHGCRSLQAIRIPEGVHTIEEQAFFNCYNVKEITIPNTVTTIEDDAFAWNGKVSEIVIPSSVTNIGEKAFRGYENLRKVVIAGDDVTLGEGIFEECTALEEIRFEGVRPVFLSYDVFGDCDATVYFHGRDCIWQEMINHDFGEATLTWVNLDDVLGEHDLVKHEYKEPTCTEGGYEAYGVCTVCEQIVPGYVELPAYGHHYEPIYTDPTCTEDGGEIWTCSRCGDSWFQPSRPALGHSYEAVVTEPSCTEGGYTTYTCTLCDSTYVANQTAALGHSYEFVVTKEPTLLEKGEMTNTCTVCGYSYTEDIPAYLQYKVCENYVEITKYTGKDTELVIPAEIEGLPVTSIGAFAFFECNSLTNISLPSGITSIGDGAFAQCVKLTDIIIPYGVTSIPIWMFSCCTSLTSISIPDSVTSINDGAFENCTSLTSINFDGDAPDFGENVFYRVVATAYYPAGNPNWNAVMLKDHGGTITWVAQSHEYTAVVTAPTCTEGGGTTYTCSICGESYVADRKEALGHNYYVVEENAEKIYTCKICGDSYVEGKKDDYYYTAYKDHVEITGCDDSAMIVVIPDKIKGLPVTRICDGAFRQCIYLYKIVIPDSVTYIGDGAFRQCESLHEIVIPDGVTYIGDYAFYGCWDLAGIFLPSGITFIGRYTFANCSDLERIYIPASVTAIRESAFRGCRGLDTIVFDGDVPDFRENVFYGVKATAYYPSKNTDWSEDVLQNYGGTITWEPQEHEYAVVVVAPTCTEKGYTAYTCSICGDSYVINEIDALGHDYESIVTAPSCVERGYTTYICTRCDYSRVADYTAPIGRHTYESVATEDGNLLYTCKDCGSSYIEVLSTGLRYEVYTDHVEVIQYTGKCTELVIPNEILGLPVTKISSDAFSDCKILLSVVIPDSVTSIDYAAFRNCPNLTSISIPDSVTFIGGAAFDGCKNLTSIDLPDGVTSIGEYAFEGCFSLTSIDLPDSVTAIGRYAFSGCTSLTSVSIPDSVTSIGTYAFSSCTSLTSVSIPDSVVSIGTYAFSSCNSLTGIHVKTNNPNYSSDDQGVLFNKAKTQLIQAPCAIAGSYVIPNSVTSIEARAFQGCINLTNISIPESVTAIGDSVFWNCSGLISVNIPDSVTYIGGSAFSDCSSLTSIDLPDSVTYIGVSAFSDCSSLTSVNIPDGVTDIYGYTFYRCSSLTSIDLPDSVTAIADYAFIECKNLTSIDLPCRLSTIGREAFYKCSSLTSIDIPDSVTVIDNYAFYKCTRLTVIYFNSDAPVFGSEVFADVTATAYYPKGNSSWAEGVLQDYGGTIIWETFEKPFDYVVYKDHVEIADYYGDDANVVIPAEIGGLPVTSIGYNAFAHCASMTSIEIADSVTAIGSGAFSGCDSLMSVYFNGDAPVFGGEIFDGIATTVYYPAENTTWTEDVKYDYDGAITWKEYTPCQHEYTAVATDPTCTEQGYTTYTCSVCENSYVMYGLKPLGHNYVFDTSKEVTGNEDGEVILTCKTCEHSYTRIIPAYLQYVVYVDHAEITGYVGKPTEVVIPSEIEGLPVTVIGDSAFYRCYSLTSISIPDSVTTIGNRAFQDCNFRSISIPDSVTSIGAWAFGGCVYLSSISIPKGMTAIADHTFDNCWELRSVSIPDGVTSIGENAFFGCAMTSISIPGSVTYIADSAFEWCWWLNSIEFSDGVTAIGNGALARCKELTSVRFEGDAPELAADAFEETTTIAYYPAGNPTWTADVKQEYGGTIAWVSYGDEKVPFTDVPTGSFFYEPVAWAVENGITNGTAATTFSPGDQCMRAHVVTFLWRAMGCPEPTRTDNPFVDVKPTDFYYKPVMWALENGITSGMDDTHFGPTSYCNRAQVVTFLYRSLGSPALESAENPFTDVAKDSFYEKPVLWAVKNDITNGTSVTTFAPGTICNRAQIVTFLYRAFVND